MGEERASSFWERHPIWSVVLMAGGWLLGVIASAVSISKEENSRVLWAVFAVAMFSLAFFVAAATSQAAIKAVSKLRTVIKDDAEVRTKAVAPALSDEQLRSLTDSALCEARRHAEEAVEAKLIEIVEVSARDDQRLAELRLEAARGLLTSIAANARMVAKDCDTHTDTEEKWQETALKCLRFLKNATATKLGHAITERENYGSGSDADSKRMEGRATKIDSLARTLVSTEVSENFDPADATWDPPRRQVRFSAWQGKRKPPR